MIGYAIVKDDDLGLVPNHWFVELDFSYPIQIRVATIFMHELGHTLGLVVDRDNNGEEDIDRLNSQPVTCMNYFYEPWYPTYSPEEWNSLTVGLEPTTSLGR
jgi:hypothetical protein